MKIYTKKGDKGETSLIGGTRVKKSHMRIDAYGDVDELNSFIGLVRDTIRSDHDRSILLDIQDRLFTIGSMLASDPVKSRMKLPPLHQEDIALLEKEIDTMNESLPALRSFILPGGHPVASYCHLARCICRRCERKVVWLSEHEPVDERIIQYLNRLSDYLFVLARKTLRDFCGEEIYWRPRMT